MDKRTIDDSCNHAPKRLYIWNIPELKQTLYMAHCKHCNTDYSLDRLQFAREGILLARSYRTEAAIKKLYERKTKEREAWDL